VPSKREPVFAPDEAVSLTVGRQGQAVELGCRVVTVHGDVIALRTEVVPIQPELLQPDTDAWLMSSGGRRLPAVLLGVEAGTPPLLRVRLVAIEGRRENRRGFYRAAMQLAPVQALLLRDGRAALRWVRLVDLSAGGARLLCAWPLRVGDTLYLRLPLADGAPCDLLARAVWCRPTRAGWEAGVSFRDLTEQERDRIVRAVFRQELRLRRR
jgi:hypothetical protein